MRSKNYYFASALLFGLALLWLLVFQNIGLGVLWLLIAILELLIAYFTKKQEDKKKQ